MRFNCNKWLCSLSIYAFLGTGWQRSKKNANADVTCQWISNSAAWFRLQRFARTWPLLHTVSWTLHWHSACLSTYKFVSIAAITVRIAARVNIGQRLVCEKCVTFWTGAKTDKFKLKLKSQHLTGSRFYFNDSPANSALIVFRIKNLRENKVF